MQSLLPHEVNMPAKLILRDKTYEVPHGITIKQALKKLDISAEEVIPTREGELVTEDTRLKDGDVIRLVDVISGG